MKKNLYFYSPKNDLNVPSKRNKHKNLEKKNMCWHLVSLEGRKEQDLDLLVTGTDPHPDPELNVTGPKHS
jgi:hypothetical protein